MSLPNVSLHLNSPGAYQLLKLSQVRTGWAKPRAWARSRVRAYVFGCGRPVLLGTARGVCSSSSIADIRSVVGLASPSMRPGLRRGTGGAQVAVIVAIQRIWHGTHFSTPILVSLAIIIGACVGLGRGSALPRWRRRPRHPQTLTHKYTHTPQHIKYAHTHTSTSRHARTHTHATHTRTHLHTLAHAHLAHHSRAHNARVQILTRTSTAARAHATHACSHTFISLNTHECSHTHTYTKHARTQHTHTHACARKIRRRATRACTHTLTRGACRGRRRRRRVRCPVLARGRLLGRAWRSFHICVSNGHSALAGALLFSCPRAPLPAAGAWLTHARCTEKVWSVRSAADAHDRAVRLGAAAHRFIDVRGACTRSVRLSHSPCLARLAVSTRVGGANCICVCGAAGGRVEALHIFYARVPAARDLVRVRDRGERVRERRHR